MDKGSSGTIVVKAVSIEVYEAQQKEIERLREALNLIRVAIDNYGNGGKSEGFALGYVDEVARAALKGDE